MNINLTMLGQLIAFVMFVVFCMKFVWPYLITAMRDRQKLIAEGLEKASAAEAQLEEANNAAAAELDEARKQAAELIAHARNRSTQSIEDAKTEAREEAGRIIQGAQAEIDQEVNRAREALRARVGDLAVEGAERILEASIDRRVHENMLNQLAAQL